MNPIVLGLLFAVGTGVVVGYRKKKKNAADAAAAANGQATQVRGRPNASAMAQSRAASQSAVAGLGVARTDRASDEYVRWLQGALNQVLSLSLPVDGCNGPLTSATIARYQSMRGLRSSGRPDDATDQQLVTDGASRPPTP